jgi:CBS domain containing-hemolysin-like protein
MVAAPDVVWLEAEQRPQEALDIIAEQPYSRYPVAR